MLGYCEGSAGCWSESMLSPDSDSNLCAMPSLDQKTRQSRITSNQASMPVCRPLQSGFPPPSDEKKNQPLLKIDCGDESRTIERAQQLLQPATSCYVRGILDHDLRSIVESWKECNSHFPDHTIYS